VSPARTVALVPVIEMVGWHLTVGARFVQDNGLSRAELALETGSAMNDDQTRPPGLERCKRRQHIRPLLQSRQNSRTWGVRKPALDLSDTVQLRSA
jgi:hypothetical protein